MRPTSALALVLCLLVVLPSASAVIVTNPNRVDLHDQSPGIVLERTIRVENKGENETRVRIEVTTFEGEDVRVHPQEFGLKGYEARNVEVRIDLPTNASGGRHDIRFSFIEYVEGASGTGATGQSAVLVPFIVHLNNLKTEVLRAEDAVQGEDTQANILVHNHLREPVIANLSVDLRDLGTGARVGQAAVQTDRLEVDGNQIVAVSLPTKELPPGTYGVSVVASHGEHVSNTALGKVRVGEKRLAVSSPEAASPSGGPVVLKTTARNVGDVELPGAVTFHVADIHGETVAVRKATSFFLAPGSEHRVEVELTLPPGTYRAHTTVAWPNGDDRSDTKQFTVQEPIPPGSGVPLPGWVAVLGLLLPCLVHRRRRDR